MNEADLYAAAEKLASVNETEFYRAQARALNRAINTARAAMSQGIRKHYNIPASVIKGTAKIKKASAAMQAASLSCVGRPVDLTKFKVNITKRNGVMAEVRKGEKRRLPHSFFVSTARASGLFHRETSSRLPIQKEFGPSVPQMACNENVQDIMDERSQDMYWRTLEHEVMRRLEK